MQKLSIRWLTCLFIAALFADAANIPDIFASSTLIVAHDDAEATASQLLSHATASSPGVAHAHTLAAMPAVRALTHVMYDEDSPSLQAGVASDLVSTLILAVESVSEVHHPFIFEELYLRNSSLLI